MSEDTGIGRAVDMGKGRAAKGKRDADGLNLKQRAFVREYLVDRNATQAAIRAGYSPHTAQVQSSDLLSKPVIKELVAEKERRLAAAADVDATWVISELRAVANADPRELVSVIRGACRHCWGIDHDRQWTRGEWLDAFYAAQKDDPKAPAPAMRGGFGYDFTRAANPECPECHGVGTERVFVNDTRKLSKAAAKLIAGVKQTKDGIELKARDQDGALLALGKVCGIFVDRREHSGPGGGPMQLQAVKRAEDLSDDELALIIVGEATITPLLEGSIDKGE